MTRETTIPVEFIALAGKVHYVVRRGSVEWSGSCPQCGGELHPDGTFPDRFRMIQRSRATGKPLGWCRSCGFTWWPGKDSGEKWEPTDAQRAEWLREREASEKVRADTVAQALSLLRKEQAWIRYHDFLTEAVREIYRIRGIPDFWIDYLGLGYNPERGYRSRGEYYISPALTIPVFEPGSRLVVNIKNRLLKPVDPGDKYRPEIAGLPAALYVADPDLKLEGRCILVEGEFKAIVTYITLDLPGTVVVGVPSKSPEIDMLKKLDACDPVIICLDPDAYRMQPGHQKTAVERMLPAFKGRARVMRLPDKIDDMINARYLDTKSLRRAVDGARKV